MNNESAEMETARSRGPESAWTFLTNHSHVLICLARDPSQRMRDVAQQVGITERAVQRILADLEEAGAITRTRDGRRNRYDIAQTLPLRHPVEAHCTVGDLLAMTEAAPGKQLTS